MATTEEVEKAPRFVADIQTQGLTDTKTGEVAKGHRGMMGATASLLWAVNKLAAEVEQLRGYRTPATQFREHRGSLEDSLATCVQIFDMADLEQHLFKKLALPRGTLKVTPYCRDERLAGWLDTHVVTIEGYGVAGFTNGMPAPLSGGG